MTDFAVLARELASASPRRIIDDALERFGDDVAIAFSGAEDVVLLEYARQTGRPFRVFSLDTGRLHPETYRYFAEVEKHFDLRIEYCVPDGGALQELVRTKGLFSFYEDGHGECCGIRKVAPLRRQLSGLKAWVTGQHEREGRWWWEEATKKECGLHATNLNPDDD